MGKALPALLCAGILTTTITAKADETYRLCGPGAAGFIRTGKMVACIGGSPDWENPASDSHGSGATMTQQSLQAVMSKQEAKIRSLVAGDCGWPPEDRDYDIGAWKPKNKLGETVYNKEMTNWRECRDRVMASKFKKENEAMKNEALRAARQAGIVR